MLKLVARSYLGYGIQKDMGVQVSLLVNDPIHLNIPISKKSIGQIVEKPESNIKSY
jgi:hypothetical protein